MKAALISLIQSGAAPLADQPHTYLLSLVHLPVAKDQYVNAFDIDTWGVTTLATCQIPPGWTITAGSSADPSGHMSGEGSLGVTWLNRKSLGYLTDLVLIRMYGPPDHGNRDIKGNGAPPTFEGTVTIGYYGSERERKFKLRISDVRLKSATHCPPPRFYRHAAMSLFHPPLPYARSALWRMPRGRFLLDADEPELQPKAP